MAIKYSKNPTLYLFSFHNLSHFLRKMSRFLSLSEVEQYKYPPFRWEPHLRKIIKDAVLLLTSKIELFVKIVNCFQSLTVVTESSILHVWHSSTPVSHATHVSKYSKIISNTEYHHSFPEIYFSK